MKDADHASLPVLLSPSISFCSLTPPQDPHDPTAEPSAGLAGGSLVPSGQLAYRESRALQVDPPASLSTNIRARRSTTDHFMQKSIPPAWLWGIPALRASQSYKGKGPDPTGLVSGMSRSIPGTSNPNVTAPIGKLSPTIHSLLGHNVLACGSGGTSAALGRQVPVLKMGPARIPGDVLECPTSIFPDQPHRRLPCGKNVDDPGSPISPIHQEPKPPPGTRSLQGGI
ncbi:hypothetical protein N7492_002365 [Penicillium capsulatum]|uniref:Uncharacterized protein n=1 Tax=Penicillium capsulatum TaxID=69766 RepID=A0A9W9LVL7_9EURO|nr:hypothetical protein N7492_002365 [Penicillium capsulatum]